MQSKVVSRKRLAARTTVVKWVIITGVVLAVAVPATLFRDRWLPSANALLAPLTGTRHADEHDDSEPGTDVHQTPIESHSEHAAGEAGHDEANALVLSPQARKNIGLTTAAIKLETYQRMMTVPAMVVGRPGRSQVEVTAPLGGRVTHIYAVQGEAVKPNQPLFDLRLTHEELVQAQSEFLRMAEELDVVAREIQRLNSVNVPGAIAGKTVREREYEQQKLQAVFNAQRQSLLLHGLTKEQVDGIIQTRTLVQDVTVVTPGHPVDGHEPPPTHPFTVRTLNVVLGQYVDAGASLCVLFDYCDLYVQGQAFEQDADDLVRAAQQGWNVVALRENGNRGRETIEDLKIVFVENEVDTESRALNFYVDLPNKPIYEYNEPPKHRFMTWFFKPGQRMQLRVPVEQWQDCIVLPVDAVAQDGVETYVFRYDGDDFQRVPVHVQYQDQLAAVIENDGSVSPGDVVATSGAHQLQMALKNKSGGAVDPHAGHNH